MAPCRLIEGCQALKLQTGRVAPVSVSMPMQPFGQVAVMITDFVQGLFANVVFVVVPAFLLLSIGWPRIIEAIADRPARKSLIDPFDTGHIENFNFWFFLIRAILYFAVWCGFAFTLWNLSVRQDSDGDRWHTATARKVSAAASSTCCSIPIRD